jgi:hypothetical protein
VSEKPEASDGSKSGASSVTDHFAKCGAAAQGNSTSATKPDPKSGVKLDTKSMSDAKSDSAKPGAKPAAKPDENPVIAPQAIPIARALEGGTLSLTALIFAASTSAAPNSNSATVALFEKPDGSSSLASDRSSTASVLQASPQTATAAATGAVLSSSPAARAVITSAGQTGSNVNPLTDAQFQAAPLNVTVSSPLPSLSGAQQQVTAPQTVKSEDTSAPAIDLSKQGQPSATSKIADSPAVPFAENADPFSTVGVVSSDPLHALASVVTQAVMADVEPSETKNSAPVVDVKQMPAGSASSETDSQAPSLRVSTAWSQSVSQPPGMQVTPAPSGNLSDALIAAHVPGINAPGNLNEISTEARFRTSPATPLQTSDKKASAPQVFGNGDSALSGLGLANPRVLMVAASIDSINAQNTDHGIIPQKSGTPIGSSPSSGVNGIESSRTAGVSSSGPASSFTSNPSTVDNGQASSPDSNQNVLNLVGSESVTSELNSPSYSAQSSDSASATGAGQDPKTKSDTPTPVGLASASLSPASTQVVEKKVPAPVQPSGRPSGTAPSNVVSQTEPPVASSVRDFSPTLTVPVPPSSAPAPQVESGVVPTLPQTHQMLDSAPAVLPGSATTSGAPNSAAEAQLNDQVNAQMHVGVRTDAFGAVEIHTVVQQSQVGITVHADRDIARWFSSEVPGLESGLNHSHLNLTGVNFDSGRSGVQTASSFQQGQPRQHFPETPGSAVSGPDVSADEDKPSETITVDIFPSAPGAGATTRVSIHA